MAESKTMDIAVLRQLLTYDPETGVLTWQSRPREMFLSEVSWKRWNTRYARKAALRTADGHGYYVGAVFHKQYISHRVIWAMAYGEWPDKIDHINGVKTDNRIANLRSVTQAENLRNAALRSDNKSGVSGVHWQENLGKWRAEITVDGVNIHLGRFASFQEACAVRSAASVKHGFHPNHGRASAG